MRRSCVLQALRQQVQPHAFYPALRVDDQGHTRRHAPTVAPVVVQSVHRRHEAPGVRLRGHVADEVLPQHVRQQRHDARAGVVPVTAAVVAHGGVHERTHRCRAK